MKISQREANRLRKRVEELERERRRLMNAWAGDWAPWWTHVGDISLSGIESAKIVTARRLGHSLVCVPKSDGNMAVYADRSGR